MSKKTRAMMRGNGTGQHGGATAKHGLTPRSTATAKPSAQRYERSEPEQGEGIAQLRWAEGRTDTKGTNTWRT